jgi:Spy/CpxP family protein refolding chaperone
LKLTEEQRNATEKIVEQMTENLHQHFLKSRSEVRAIVDESFSRVKAGLSDDQKKKLDVMREKFEKHRKERRDRP